MKSDNGVFDANVDGFRHLLLVYAGGHVDTNNVDANL